MREMRALARQRLHALERRPDVPWLTQIIAVNVHRVRKLERVGGAREHLQDLPRRHAARPHRIVDRAYVALCPPRLPARDAARVHDLDGVGSGGSEEPRHILAHSCQLACRQHVARSEEHTSELQSHHDLVCRLLLEKKKKKDSMSTILLNTSIFTD